jgi:hypothetical protein
MRRINIARTICHRIAFESPFRRLGIMDLGSYYEKSLSVSLSPTHTTRMRGATQNLRGGAPNKQSQPTSEIKPPHTSDSTPALDHAPPAH